MTIEELKHQADATERQWVAACNEAQRCEEAARHSRGAANAKGEELKALLTVLGLYGVQAFDDEWELRTGRGPHALARDESGGVAWEDARQTEVPAHAR